MYLTGKGHKTQYNGGLNITMVCPMLINTDENILNVVYKQKISTNKIKNANKTYEYNEVNIPVELLNYWSSITKEEIKTICYIISQYDGVKTTFITPSYDDPKNINLDDIDLSILHNVDQRVTPYRVIPIKLRKRGNENNLKYYIRLNNREFITPNEYVRFKVNPYRDDPILRVKGLVTLDDLIIL